MRLPKVQTTIVSLSLLCGSISAQHKVCTPLAAGLVHLKEAIDSNQFDTGDYTSYRFSRIILEAACANGEKNKDVIRRRVGLMWQQFRNEPICSSCSLHLSNALPYAFSKRYQRLMLVVAKGWELDLNFPDETQRTTLDHLDEAIASAPDEKTGNMLKEYREIYLEAGAKRRSDLSFFVKNLTSRFDAVRPYGYGLFPVKKKDKWGWVNERGIVIIPLQYKAVRYFVKDIFEVSDDGVNFYYVDLKNQRVKSPWEARVQGEPWAGQPKQKKVIDVDGNEIPAYLTPDTLRTPNDSPDDRPGFKNWLNAKGDLVGYGYRDRAGNPYGAWKYYFASENKWELFCEGYYTMVQADRLQVDPDIAKQFHSASTMEAKNEFVKELKDRFLFTGEWRFYQEGRVHKIVVLDDKVTIPYMVSQSAEGTIMLSRLVVETRMAGGIITECQLSASGHIKKMMTKDLMLEFDDNGKPIIHPLPDLE